MTTAEYLDNANCMNWHRHGFQMFLTVHAKAFPYNQSSPRKVRIYEDGVLEEAWDAYMKSKTYANIEAKLKAQAIVEPSINDCECESVACSNDCEVESIVCSSPIALEVKLDEGALLPYRAHPSDIGMDICVNKIDFMYTAGSADFAHAVIIDTGVAVRPPAGYYVEVVPNSRLAKTYYYYGNSFGVIDPNYRGTIKVVLRAPKPMAVRNAIKHWKHGTVCGQLILRKAEYCNIVQVSELDETDRQDGGFGSTANV